MQPCESDPSVDKGANDSFALVRMGTKVAIAEFREGGDIEFMTTSAFREYFSNRRHGRKTLGSAWIMHSKRRTYGGGVVFRPDGAVPNNTLNLWTGWATVPDSEKDCSLIIRHIHEVIAAGNEDHFNYIISWLAHIVQKPAEKPDVALVLKGKKGVGKDTLAEVMKSIVGRRHYAHVPAADRLTARFNAAFATAVLIHVEEAIWGGQRESKGVVQSLITCPEMPLERKNIDTVQIDSFCRLLFTTNESWAVPATADERRYAVFEVSPKWCKNRDYFGPLYRQIQNGGCAAFLHFLLNWDQPEEIELRNAPRTAGLLEQKLSGLRGVERWWYEVLCDGDFPADDWSCEVNTWDTAPKSARREVMRQAYEDWMSHRRYQGEIVGPSEFGSLLKAMCPEMESTRPKEDGQRVRKYTFPPIGVCRAAFATHMAGEDNGISWPD